MQKIRVLGLCIALGGMALLGGCVAVPGDPVYGGAYGGAYGGGYPAPYYSDPSPVFVAPAPVYINGGASYYDGDRPYYGRRPYYDGRPYYGRPGYPAVLPGYPVVRPGGWQGSAVAPQVQNGRPPSMISQPGVIRPPNVPGTPIYRTPRYNADP